MRLDVRIEMFRLSKPSTTDVVRAIEEVRDQPRFRVRFLSSQNGRGNRELPVGFVHDRRDSCLGHGESDFERARCGFQNWLQFDLGWVRVANPQAPIVPGEIVAVETHALGLWSLNLSRITEIIDTDLTFGFTYITTPHHIEEGEESFLIEADPAGNVWYRLEAVSRPRHALARLAYPATRRLQKRFAQESHARMALAVRSGPQDVSARAKLIP